MLVIAQLKTAWKTVASSPPGRRFERFHESRRQSGTAGRILFTVLGSLLLVAGAVLLFVPGPGLLLIAFGAALIAQQSLWLARALDRSELILRKRHREAKGSWRKASITVRAALVALVGIGAAGATYAGYLLLFSD